MALGKRVKQTITVLPGEDFERINDRIYKINLLQDSDYKMLFASPKDIGPIPEKVVHLWSMASKTSIQAFPDTADSSISRYFSRTYRPGNLQSMQR
jgi:hypothetical protein